MGSFPRCSVHHFLKKSSMYRYSGAFGGGASANALEMSAPTTISPCFAAIAQNNRSLGASSALAYVWLSVIVLFCLGLPLHTIRLFLVPHGFRTYVHSMRSAFALCGSVVGSPNIP